MAAMLVAGRVSALELSGILLYAADESGAPLGPRWHTATGLRAGPIGFTRWGPGGVDAVPFANGRNGEIAVPLLPGVHITTLFWQFDPGAFPPNLVMNLYFNGDKTNPGVSVLIPDARGFTEFRLNPAFRTLSFYLGEVENMADVLFDDGQLRARVEVAFYMPSAGPTYQWRPGEFVDLDRVGVRELSPDQQADGIFLFELVVRPSSRPSRRPGEERRSTAVVPGLLDPHGTSGTMGGEEHEAPVRPDSEVERPFWHAPPPRTPPPPLAQRPAMATPEPVTQTPEPTPAATTPEIEAGETVPLTAGVTRTVAEPSHTPTTEPTATDRPHSKPGAGSCR